MLHRWVLMIPLLVSQLPAQDIVIVRSSLAKLKARDPKAADDVAAGSVAERNALKSEWFNALWTHRLMVGEWCLRAQALRDQLTPPTSGFLAQHHANPLLDRAWTLFNGAETAARQELLNAPTQLIASGTQIVRSRAIVGGAAIGGKGIADRESAWKALESFRLEGAIRQRRLDRIAEAVKPFATRTDLVGRDLLYTFMASAHLGQWDLFQRLGAQLLASGDASDRIRSVALVDWTTPDYITLLQQLSGSSRPAGANLPEAEFQVKNLALQRKSIKTEDAALAEGFKTLEAWEESGPVAHSILRIGAVTHWLKPGKTPVPLVGSMGVESLFLEGSTELPLKDGLAWRQERYRLLPSPEKAGRWVGTLEVTQQAIEGNVPASQVFQMTLSVRLDIEQLPMAPQWK